MRALTCMLIAAAGCSPGAEPGTDTARSGDSLWTIEEVELPAAPGSLAPRLTRPTHAMELGLSWIEPGADGSARVLATSTFPADGGAFETPRVLVDSDALFVNWADVPGFWSIGRFPAVLDNMGYVDPRFERPVSVGTWLQGLPDGGYAYHVMASLDGGSGTRLHADASPTEHGFVSATGRLRERDLGLQLFWLDGHATGGGHGDGHGGHGGGAGAMALRTAFAGPAGVEGEVELDARVCDCCGTAAVATTDGPLVVYRDRGEDEVRDISLVRWTGDGWSEPAPVAEDGWRIAGCPVNGPAVAAQGENVAVAWFTGVPTPRVRLAVSRDGGRSFDPPADVLVAEEDAGQLPLGRPALEFDAGGDLHLLHLVELPALGRGFWRLERFAAPPTPGDPWVRAGRRELCPTSADRDAGFPCLAGTAAQNSLRPGRAMEILAVVRDSSTAPARLRAFWLDRRSD